MGRRGYPAEFRRKVLALVQAGRSVADVARDQRPTHQGRGTVTTGRTITSPRLNRSFDTRWEHKASTCLTMLGTTCVLYLPQASDRVRR